MTRLIYSQLSLNDLEKILDFIASDNPRAAIAFSEGLIRTCELIAQHPEMGQQREDIAPSIRLFVHEGYAIYYRYDEDAVRIQRFLHPAQDISSQSFG